jgi:hypothetical protein
VDAESAQRAGVVPRSFDERTSPVTFGEGEPDRYRVLHEIGRRAWHSRAPVLGARREDTEGRSPVAAIVRDAAAFA